MSIVTAHEPAAEPLAHDAPIPDILDAAAAIIAANGRHVGNYWPALDSNIRQPWTPGTPCSADAAIGLAIGLRRAWDVETHIVPAVTSPDFDEPPHPALAALMAHLGVDSINAVFAWSDEHEADQIAAVMRECSAKLRAGEAA